MDMSFNGYDVSPLEPMSALSGLKGQHGKLSSSWQRLLFSSLVALLIGTPEMAAALPPADETPEEILRTEIILNARSPVDGKPMTPTEYAILQAEEQAPYRPPNQLAPEVKGTVQLLKLRKFIKTYLPFIPIR